MTIGSAFGRNKGTVGDLLNDMGNKTLINGHSTEEIPVPILQSIHAIGVKMELKGNKGYTPAWESLFFEEC